jgi:hypothetical protein
VRYIRIDEGQDPATVVDSYAITRPDHSPGTGSKPLQQAKPDDLSTSLPAPGPIRAAQNGEALMTIRTYLRHATIGHEPVRLRQS